MEDSYTLTIKRGDTITTFTDKDFKKLNLTAAIESISDLAIQTSSPYKIRRIAFAGVTGSGKSTAGRWLRDTRGFLYTEYTKYLKSASKALFGFTDAQVEGDLKDVVDERWGFTPRKAQEIMGTEICLDKLCDFLPIEKGSFWEKRFDIFLQSIDPDTKLAVCGIRYPQQAEFLKKKGFLIVKVNREGLSTNGHASNKAINEIKEDVLINNNGKDIDLYYKEMQDILGTLI
jgi:hypothetical protein